jgi:hypothetical protein
LAERRGGDAQPASSNQPKSNMIIAAAKHIGAVAGALEPERHELARPWRAPAVVLKSEVFSCGPHETAAQQADPLSAKYPLRTRSAA